MWRYYPSLLKHEIDCMELEEYYQRITSALLREGDQLNLASHGAYWNRLANHVDEKGFYSVVSISDLFNHDAYSRLIKGEAVPASNNNVNELEEKLERAEWVHQEAQRRLAERRRVNAD